MIQERMFEIKCDGCGRKAEVPFKPRAGRPVYCRTCFSERRSNRPRKAGLNFSFNEKNAWARRGKGFTGRREEQPTSIFQR
jgi:CxxC-x17-CxxC domain-containing protein